MDIKEYIDSRIAAALSRVELKNVKKDGARLTAQTDDSSGDVLDDVPFFQQYGYASRPKEGTEGIAVNLAGSRENQVIISTDSGEFILEQLAAGEVALFHPGSKDYFHFLNNGTITLKTKTLEVEADINLSGKLTAGEIVSKGAVKDSVGSVGAIRDTLNSHTHLTTTPGNPTGPAVPQVIPGA